MQKLGSSFKSGIENYRPQEFLGVFYRGLAGNASSYEIDYISANEGDFTADGVTINQNLCQGDDLVFGTTAADTISFSLINEGNKFENFPWGDMETFIGVQTGGESYHMPIGLGDRVTAFVMDGMGTIYYAVEREKKVISTSINNLASKTTVLTGSGVITSLIWYKTDNIMYAIGPKDFWVIANGTSYDLTYSARTGGKSTHLIRRHYLNTCIIFEIQPSLQSNTEQRHLVTTRFKNIGQYNPGYDPGMSVDYEMHVYAYMGRFQISKPDSLQNDVIDVNDAMGILSKYDKDATSRIEELESDWSNVTYESLIKKMLEAGNTRLSVRGDTDINLSTAPPELPENTSYTRRELVNRALEHFGRSMIYSLPGETETSISMGFVGYRMGCFQFKTVCRPSAMGYQSAVFGWDRIVGGSLRVKNYRTKRIGTLQVKTVAGETIEEVLDSTAGYDTYQISQNPFQDDTYPSTLIDALTDEGMSYYPATFEIIGDNPAVELGDMVMVSIAENDQKEVVSAFGDETDIVYVDPIIVPVMHRTINWRGICYSTYEVTGNTERYVDKNNGSYKDSSANQFAMDYTDGLLAALPTVKYIDEASASDYTIGNSGYAYGLWPTGITASKVIAISVLTWDTNSGAFTPIVYNNNSQRWYIVGTPGVTITGLKCRFWYLDD